MAKMAQLAAGLLTAICCQSALANDSSLLQRYELQPGEGAAAVKGKTDLPQQVDQKACRLLLTEPQRVQLRQQLSEQVGFTISDSVSYFAGRINNERLWTADGWQHCSGDVELADSDASLANLAVRAAWQMRAELTPEQLKPLLQLSLAQPQSSADAVTLIAHLAPAERQFSYLQQNLQPQQLSLDIARYHAADLYNQQQEYRQALAILAPCNSIECRRLRAQTEQKKEQQDAENLYDLDSYFPAAS